MRYFGGKQRIANELIPIIDLLRGDRTYFEPFVGGANVITRVEGGRRVASDVVPELINMYKALQTGWQPPGQLSREEYDQIKAMTEPHPLKAFAGFGCSFAGKYFGGYASSGERNYAANAASSLKTKVKGMADVEFYHGDYRSFDPTNCLIYCDPPYNGTTSYSAAGKFNSESFWAICRWWALDNTVLVSEYDAPSDWTVLWEKSVKTDIRGKDGKINRTEKLFLVPSPRGGC